MDRQWKHFNFFSKTTLQNPSPSTTTTEPTAPATKTNRTTRTGKTRGKRNNDHLDIKRIDITATTCCIAEKAVAAAARSSKTKSSKSSKSSTFPSPTIPPTEVLEDHEHPMLVLGDSKGSLHFVDVMGNGIVQEMPKAHSGTITQLQYAAQVGLVVSVGGGEDARTPEDIAFSQRVVMVAEKHIRAEAEHDRGHNTQANAASRNFGTLGGGVGAASNGLSGGQRSGMGNGNSNSNSNNGSNTAHSTTGGGPAGTAAAVIKLWQIEDGGGGLFFPRCIQTIPVFGGQYAVPERVVAVSVLPDLSQIAVGLGNGACLVLRGDLLRPKSMRRVLVQPVGEYSVTNVAWGYYEELDPTRMAMNNGGGGKPRNNRHSGNQGNNGHQGGNRRIGLYVSTQDRMISYPNLDIQKDQDKQLIQGVILDQQGCAPGCLTVDGKGNAVVGHEEGVFFYRPRERGPTCVCGGKKKHVTICGRYMVVVTQATGSKLQVYDLQHKFVASTVSLRSGGGASMNSATTSTTALAAASLAGLSATDIARLDAAVRGDGDVSHVVNCGNQAMFVLTTTHRVYALREKKLSVRLNELYRKHLYSLALRVVDVCNEQANHLDEDGGSGGGSGGVKYVVHPASIHKRYGDHLYDKGDYTNAVQEYIQTIGHLDSSVVIRRFLDAQQIQHLTSYLEAYHDDATITPMPEHTILLIHCYTKQQKNEALHTFLGLDQVWKGSSGEIGQHMPNGFVGGSGSGGGGGPSEEERRERLDMKSAVRALREANYVDEALELSRREGDHPTYLQILLEEGHDDTPYEKACEALMYIQKLSFTEAETTLLAHAKALVKSAPTETTNLLMTICTPKGCREWGSSQEQHKNKKEQRMCSNPEAYLPAFVDYSSDRDNKFSYQLELRRFLWHVVATDSATVKVWNTLLELCLHGAIKDTKESNKGSATSTEEVMKILKNPKAKYDVDQALVLVQRHHFAKGQLYLYEKRKYYHMIIQHYMDLGDHRSILSTGRKYGDRDSNLWRKILTYYSSMGVEETTDCEPYIIQALKHISTTQTLSPMLVVNILAKNKRITLTVIRDFVISHCQKAASTTQEAEEEAQSFNADTVALQDKVQALETRGLEFQNTKDHLFDSQPLDLPSMHFMSGHSYNLDNLTEMDDGNRECAHTGADHRSLLLSAQRLKERSADNENFYRELSDASNQKKGIECIADYFGRALMTPLHFVDVQSKNKTTRSSPRGSTNSSIGMNGSNGTSDGNPFA